MSRTNIGVAIRVPEPHGGRLQRWRELLGDPNAAAIVPHVTLLPPTLVSDPELPDIHDHLRKVADEERPYRIVLRGSATFQPVSPVVFVPLVAGISETERLEGRVRSGPLARPARFPYHPHVTVAHDLPEPVLDRAYRALADFAAAFRVCGFTLFDQTPEGAWRARSEFPFGAAHPVHGPPVSVPGW